MLPPIVEKERIIAYCGPEAYQAGIDFLLDDPFYVYYREWMTVKGICEGNASPSYGVKVFFDERGIAYSSCTCAHSHAPCKHIAALLIVWHRNPAAVVDRKKWAHSLEKMSKRELIVFIEKVIDLYPDMALGCDSCIIQS